MSRIDVRPVRVLPEDLINQIAAGEVVERPASVVKELVENAIDAGATKITVDVEAGGVGLCRVSDDGHGMSRDDAVLSVIRHATSKVGRPEDLLRIESFGFRGEALPSIAAVSRFSMETRRSDDEEGTRVSLEGGGDAIVTPCGPPVGTTIEVRDLFFNVPARRKFLRALPTESAHITDAVTMMALSQPAITFVLTRDGRVVRELLRCHSREERTLEVLKGRSEGKVDYAKCEGTRGPLRLEAFLSPPEKARAGASGLHVFVNGRPVRDRSLARSIAHAYGSVLAAGMYPSGVVFLELPPESVDVNVHPQKAEVRFAEGRAVADAVFRIAEDALAKSFGTVARRFAPPPRPSMPAVASASGPSLFKEIAGPSATWSGSGAVGGDVPAPSDEVVHYPHAPNDLLSTGQFSRADVTGLKFLAQLRGTFLLCEGPDALVVLDQHAAAERVMFDRLRRGYRDTSVATQRLLIPALFSVSALEMAVVSESRHAIEKAGFELDIKGSDTVAVLAVPQLLAKSAPDTLACGLLAEIGRTGPRAVGQAIDLALATMACHASIRAHDRVTPEEARALLSALAEVDFSGHCPHGRPIVTRVPFRELEHRVGRR